MHKIFFSLFYAIDNFQTLLTLMKGFSMLSNKISFKGQITVPNNTLATRLVAGANMLDKQIHASAIEDRTGGNGQIIVFNGPLSAHIGTFCSIIGGIMKNVPQPDVQEGLNRLRVNLIKQETLNKS